LRLNEISNRVNPGAVKEISMKYDDWHLLEEFMLKNCSQFLKVMKQVDYGRNLWHGWGNKQVPDIFLGKSIPDRKPRQASEKQQASLDEKLSQIGYKALRSNSLFCIGNRHSAEEFGTPYKIFPLNGFSFTAIQYESTPWGKSKWWRPTDYSEMSLDDFRRMNKFNNSRLDLAINTGNEIWINGRFLSFAYTEENEVFLAELLDTL
jgi:hypothetical protein